MKASTKCEIKKRKKDVHQDSMSESPKKAKVHAQRKFAQGAAVNSSAMTLIKDKVRPATSVPASGPLLSTKCPNTEDFLTFLCFRRTSILPPKLDFFKDATGAEAETSGLGAKSSTVNTNYKQVSEISKKFSNKKNEKTEEGKKSQGRTVQALRKKYQEQRLAKEKVSNMRKLAQKVKGKNMMRTRSSGAVVAVSEGKSEGSKKQVVGKKSKRFELRARRKVECKVEMRRGLRSRGKIIAVEEGEKGKLVTKGSDAASIGVAGTKRSEKGEVRSVGRGMRGKKAEGFSDFSSDDNEPLFFGRKKRSSGKIGEISREKTVKKEQVMNTRSQASDLEPARVSTRPTRKTKEAAAIYMEMITKKLVSPEKSGDDDVSSVESFPELPNAKRNEQREFELRAKALAIKRPEPKQQSEVKLKETKKDTFKKNILSDKIDTKSEKNDIKKGTIQKSVRKYGGKYSSSLYPAKKLKKELMKRAEEKNQQICFLRPSTRGRPQEETETVSKKLAVKLLVNKPTKSLKEGESENELVNIKKPKLDSELKASFKNKEKEKQSEASTTKIMKKGAEKRDQSINEKVEPKGTRDTKKEKENLSTQKELSKKKKIAEESESKKRKTRCENVKEKQLVKRISRRKESLQEVGSYKRPTRKCSTADKVWIDIDAFTSDEEEVLSPNSEGKTRAASMRLLGKDVEGLKSEKSSFGLENKLRVVKSKDSEKERWFKEEKGDGFKARGTNIAGKEAGLQKQSYSFKPEQSGKQSESKTSRSENEPKSETAQFTRKETKMEEGNEKENDTSDLKKGIGLKTGKDVKVDENFGGKKRVHGQEMSGLDAVNQHKKSKLFDDKRAPYEDEEEKVEKNSGFEYSRESKVKSDVKKSENNSSNVSKKELDKSRGLRERGKKEKESKEEESVKRRRPVRQCSTGEKRWIETDSDSFSFYESSDDEDDLPIVDFSSKNRVKSSPMGTKAKENKNVKESKKGKMEEKITGVKNSEEPRSDHFSDSDEEPLQKKTSFPEEQDFLIIKPCPENLDKKENKVVVKSQKVMPGLHPLKKPCGPTETHSVGKESHEVMHPTDVSSPKPKSLITVGSSLYDPKDGPALESQRTLMSENNESPVAIVPNKIELILHSLKMDKTSEENSQCSESPGPSYTTVPHLPTSLSPHAPINQMSCGYQINTIAFPLSREPISTHGLDLLSEVALPTTPKEKMSSQTERIEKWLKESLAVDEGKKFDSCEEEKEKEKSEKIEKNQRALEKPAAESACFYEKPTATLAKPNSSFSNIPELQKFGQMELIESQKLLKKNLFSAELRQEVSRTESLTPKKALTSVQDLLKLQKERKDLGKTISEKSSHLKNCKCNSCVVKKGWFKNKPPPKPDGQKSTPSEDFEEVSKPFESLTKALTKVAGETSNSRMSVSVAPLMIQNSSSLSASQDLSSSFSKDGNERRVFQQRKLSFLDRMKERKRKEAEVTKPSSIAFSPNNESSVYAFEPEPEQSLIVNAPFRSKARESRTNSSGGFKSDDDSLKLDEDESLCTTFGLKAEKTGSVEAKDSGKTLQSASIAVQVNLDSEAVGDSETLTEAQDGKSIEISTQTEVPEEDSDTPMFYIPLQQARAGGSVASSDQQTIQGVALKLGTEGPMGPNQRVIMKAKLVTKPPDSPSVKAVVMPQPKRIFDQKINNPPIGTVQPTTRKPPGSLPESKSTITDPHATESLPSSDKSHTYRETTRASASSSALETNLLISKTSKISSVSIGGRSFSKNKEKVSQSGSKEKNDVSDEHSPGSSFTKPRKTNKQKGLDTSINPSNSTWLPPAGTSSKLVEAPTFHPTEKEFLDPFEFFERIRPAAEKFGLCRIIPPCNFKPDCKVSDDMRFTAYNQYVHRMFHRWGPNVKEMMAIKKYLLTQTISLKQPPWIGGIEVDLPRLYQSVQNCGGLMKVMEKKKWNQVADMMKIPKAAQDRVTKLDDIYCKYLLPYDTLSHDERQRLFDEVEKDWRERESGTAETQEEDETEEENYIEECEECIVKGKNMALNQFYRIARNTMTMWFKSSEPSPREVENEFWKHVRERSHHVCVHSGSIDSSGWGYGFPIAKNNPFSKHPWNLKVLTNNCGSVLRSLGPVMGVTVPTLHVGMVFTAFCWYRDPHGLPWIDYLHTGAPKIWYGISDDNSTVFQEALVKLLPRYIKNKTIWLPSDTAMIPPDLLVEHGVSLCHTVQEPGQFILVFPRAFTSSICTGYLVSESVYFAQQSWLVTAQQVFKDIQESCEPSMFSLEKLLFNIAADFRANVEVLRQVLPMIWHVRQKELDGRKTLFNLGLKSSERLPTKVIGSKKKRGRWAQEDDGDYECEVCRTNLYVSLVTNSHEEAVYCLPHAVELLTQKRHHLKYCKLLYTYTQDEMNDLIEKLEQRIENKSQKKLPAKSSASGK